MTREAWVVVDLGFGDAGKGATVDFLVRERGADLVVRFNGGAQAGHTVVAPDGRCHTFAQLGAGSFVPEVRTHLGPAFVLHPGGLRVEADRLAALGVGDALERLSVDGRALLISPFQQAAGRLRELLRGADRHGTCGVGVGEAVGDAEARQDDVLRASDLAHPDALAKGLRTQQARKREELAAAGALDDPRAALEWALLNDAEAVDRVVVSWRDMACALTVLDPTQAREVVAASETVVFEGAQGVLLDQTWGLQPHTTWSDCTPAGARALLAGSDAQVRVLGVTRAYATRHGAGPFPTHDPAHDARLAEPHNDDAGWQGAFRRGPLDLVLLRYALEACGGVDGLALNHLDRVGAQVPVCLEYEEELPTGPLSAEQVARAQPRVVDVSRDRLLSTIEERLGVAVWLEGHGPRAVDRRWRGAYGT